MMRPTTAQRDGGAPTGLPFSTDPSALFFARGIAQPNAAERALLAAVLEVAIADLLDERVHWRADDKQASPTGFEHVPPDEAQSRDRADDPAASMPSAAPCPPRRRP
jgi:hypothetical protein